MIKTLVDVAKSEKTYPYLGFYKGRTKCVVLFSAPGEGVVLKDQDDSCGPRHPVGHHCASWCEDDFEALSGGFITIRNP